MCSGSSLDCSPQGCDTNLLFCNAPRFLSYAFLHVFNKQGKWRGIYLRLFALKIVSVLISLCRQRLINSLMKTT